MQANDIALILAAACALATFGAHDVHSAALPDQRGSAPQTTIAVTATR